MKALEKGAALPVTEIIEAVAAGANIDPYCLYAKPGNDTVTEDMICFLDDTPTVDADDNEIYPVAARQNRLDLLYYGQQFADVVQNVRHQKAGADKRIYVRALNYYLENDDFLDV